MCQLCQVAALADKARWPKPLEKTLADLRDIIARTHRDVESYLTKTRSRPTSSSSSNNDKHELERDRASLATTARTIATAIELLEKEREDWWKGKSALRKVWLEQCNEEKLRALQLINNKVIEMLREMEAGLGRFARWVLNVREL